jgi:hypothetical protein
MAGMQEAADGRVWECAAQAVDVGTSCWLMAAVRVHTGIQRIGVVLRLEPRLKCDD